MASSGKAQRLMDEEKYWDAIQRIEPSIPRMEAPARPGAVLLARATEEPE